MRNEADQMRVDSEGGSAVPSHRHPVEVVRYSPEDEVSVAWMVAVLIKHRYAILASMVAVAIIGVIHLLLTFSPTYTATASFMPESGGRGNASGLQAVASRFGVEVGGAGGPSSPNFYADLLDSREILAPIVTDTFAFQARVDGRPAQLRGTLVDLLGKEDLAPALARHRTIEWLQGISSERVTGSTGVVDFSVTTPWAPLSAAIAGRLLDRLNEFNLQTLQSRAASERRFVEERLAEVRQDLRAAEEELRHFLETNRTFESSPELMFQHQRLERQVQMRQQLFTSLSQSYEQARLQEVRNTPVITVLEAPVEPVDRNPRGLKQRGILGLVLGLVLGSIYAFGREFSSRDSAQSPGFRELRRVTNEALEDLGRLPRRMRKLIAR